jgi:hypothetical protein
MALRPIVPRPRAQRPGWRAAERLSSRCATKASVRQMRNAGNRASTVHFHNIDATTVCTMTAYGRKCHSAATCFGGIRLVDRHGV